MGTVLGSAGRVCGFNQSTPSPTTISSSQSSNQASDSSPLANDANDAHDESDKLAAPAQRGFQRAPSKRTMELREMGVVQIESDELSQIAQMRRHFDRFDLDGSGYLDRDELTHLLRGLYKPTEQEMDDFLSFFDENHDGRVEWKEFKHAFQRMDPQRYRREEELLRLKKQFQRFDTNGDKYLTGDELVQVAKETIQIDADLSDKAMMLFDENLDNKIDFDEFLRTIERLQGSLDSIWESHRATRRKRGDDDNAQHVWNADENERKSMRREQARRIEKMRKKERNRKEQEEKLIAKFA